MKEWNALKEAGSAFRAAFESRVQQLGLEVSRQKDGTYCVYGADNKGKDVLAVLEKCGLGFEKIGPEMYRLSCAISARNAVEEGIGTKIPDRFAPYAGIH